MVMKGFGEGVTEEAQRQAAVMSNAARFLTNEAKAGTASIGTTDNRKTYNQESNVTIQVDNMSIRDQTDIKALAAELAGIVKSQQRSRGLRMA